MKHGLIAVLGVCLFAATLSAEPYYPSGYYLGLNLGQGYSQYPGTSATASNMFGRAYIGYNFSPYVGLDIGYLLLPTLKHDDHQLSNSGYTANLRLVNPLSEGFSIYGQVGGAILTATEKSPAGDQRENATVLTYGGGLDYVFANVGGLHMTLDYQRIAKMNDVNVASPSYDLYSLGVYYQF